MLIIIIFKDFLFLFWLVLDLKVLNIEPLGT